MINVIDTHCFAGGLALGVMQGGAGQFNLVAKKELPAAFGAAQMEANRELLPGPWDTQAATYAEWEPHEAQLIVGNPPCSGFSLMSSPAFRGPLSRANACMWGITGYAGLVRPEIFMFESVQGAYTQGLELMRGLRERLEAVSGLRYTLTHVLHSARSCGAPQLRRRYLFIAHRVPFGVEEPTPQGLPTVEDAIDDLATLPLQWEAQPYPLADRSAGWVSPWAMRRWSKWGRVDGHVPADNLGIRRINDLLAAVPWVEGEGLNKVVRRSWEAGNELAPVWEKNLDKLLASDWHMGWQQPSRLVRGKIAPVITGGALDGHVHYSEPRTLTHREVARIMGFPDDWRIASLNERSLRAGWGKGVTVTVGRWIGVWLRAALVGSPGQLTGAPLGDRERVINLTNNWKKAVPTS